MNGETPREDEASNSVRRHDDRSVLEVLGGGRVLGADANTGAVEMRFFARREFCHPGGVQGGFITGWLDAAMAHAVMVRTNREQVPATLEIKVNFLRPVFPQQELTVRAEIVRLGRSMVFAEARLLDAEGVLLATATSTGKLVPSGGVEPGMVR